MTRWFRLILLSGNVYSRGILIIWTYIARSLHLDLHKVMQIFLPSVITGEEGETIVFLVVIIMHRKFVMSDLKLNLLRIWILNLYLNKTNLFVKNHRKIQKKAFLSRAIKDINLNEPLHCNWNFYSLGRCCSRYNFVVSWSVFRQSLFLFDIRRSN